MARQGFSGAPLALRTLTRPRAAGARWRAGTARNALRAAHRGYPLPRMAHSNSWRYCTLRPSCCLCLSQVRHTMANTENEHGGWANVGWNNSLFLRNCKQTRTTRFNPIDVELHVEQMPGMETNVDSTGRAWPNKSDVVCLLHKCLEGLKQAGNVWQVNHSAFLDKLHLPKHHATFKQSEVDPTLFIAHCMAGIIAILVWVDDIWVAFSIKGLYDEFVELYKARFPSVHSLGCNKFAGVSIDYQPGSRMVIHQRPHIELAYQKFVTDKVSAAKSPAVYRPAISDRNSPSISNIAGP